MIQLRKCIYSTICDFRYISGKWERSNSPKWTMSVLFIAYIRVEWSVINFAAVSICAQMLAIKNFVAIENPHLRLSIWLKSSQRSIVHARTAGNFCLRLWKGRSNGKASARSNRENPFMACGHSFRRITRFIVQTTGNTFYLENKTDVMGSSCKKNRMGFNISFSAH